MLQWIENLTYKTPPGRNIASTSRISLPKLDASILENASTFTTGSRCFGFGFGCGAGRGRLRFGSGLFFSWAGEGGRFGFGFGRGEDGGGGQVKKR